MGIFSWLQERKRLRKLAIGEARGRAEEAHRAEEEGRMLVASEEKIRLARMKKKGRTERFFRR